MTKEKERLIKMVTQEIENIKLHATKEEIDKLDILSLDPAVGSECMYGQMTGHCRSIRAVELIKKCTVKYTEGGRAVYCEIISKKDAIIEATDKGYFYSDYEYLSMLEYFIIDYDYNNRDIIAYLRGETDTLNLWITENE